MLTLEFDLLENAKDSLKNAVHLLAWPDGPETEKLKHAILSVSHCAELLLKERLRRIDPDCIYEKRKGVTSNSRTINAKEAIDLLQTVGNVTLHTKDKDALKECRDIRNHIEHFEFTITHKQGRLVVARVLSFIFCFGSEQLGCNLEQEFRSDGTWEVLLEDLYEFTDDYGNRVSARLFAQGIPIDSCDHCGQETVNLRRASCALCGSHHVDVSDN